MNYKMRLLKWKPRMFYVTLIAMLVAASVASFYLLQESSNLAFWVEWYESGRRLFIRFTPSEIEGFKRVIARNTTLTIIAWAIPVALLIFKLIRKTSVEPTEIQ